MSATRAVRKLVTEGRKHFRDLSGNDSKTGKPLTTRQKAGGEQIKPAAEGTRAVRAGERKGAVVGGGAVVGAGVIAATISQLSKPKSENRLSKAAAKPIAEKLVKNNNDKKLSAKQLSEFKAMFKKKMDENKSLIKRGMPPRKTFKFMGKPYLLREK
tara:strand:+ start:1968 stop:2438 length:471 start_codon:yes stop_codon:yes gene_type:complete